MQIQTDKFGRRKLTEEQIQEILPGYEPVENGIGHYFDGAEGRMLHVGAHPGDQCYGSDKLGMINVSALLEYLDNKGAKHAMVTLDQGIKDHVSKVEISPEWVRKIPSARLKVPVLMMVAVDGVNVVDGHHRIARHILNRSRAFPAFIAEPEALAAFQVRQFLQQPNGAWKLIGGLSPEQCDKMVAIANSRWTPQNIIRQPQRR